MTSLCLQTSPVFCFVYLRARFFIYKYQYLMDFAKKILNKYGWKEGNGLGKKNNGIAEPLKANLKFDNAGLGVDRAAEFNDHWWERCFNEAASNVDVKVTQNGDVNMERKHGKDAVEISTKGYSVKKLKKAAAASGGSNGSAIYANFLQSATLTQSGSEIVNESGIGVNDIAVTEVKVLTDEELFRACGGRTAHKGARHGLKLSGKLARLEQQEKELLAKMPQKQEQSKEDVSNEIKKRKKKDIQSESVEQHGSEDTLAESKLKKGEQINLEVLGKLATEVHHKKNKNKLKREAAEKVVQANLEPSKMKQRLERELEAKESVLYVANEEQCEVNRKHKKSKDTVATPAENTEDLHTPKNTKKVKKKQNK